MLYFPEITVQPQTYREHHAFYHKHPQKVHVRLQVMKFVMCATPRTIHLAQSGCMEPTVFGNSDMSQEITN